MYSLLFRHILFFPGFHSFSSGIILFLPVWPRCDILTSVLLYSVIFFSFLSFSILFSSLFIFFLSSLIYFLQLYCGIFNYFCHILFCSFLIHLWSRSIPFCNILLISVIFYSFMDYSILLVLGLFYSIIFLSVLEIFPCLLLGLFYWFLASLDIFHSILLWHILFFSHILFYFLILLWARSFSVQSFLFCDIL